MNQPDPRIFIACELKLRKRSERNWDVTCRDILVGHIFVSGDNNGKKSSAWGWRLHGPKPEMSHGRHGGAPDKKLAKMYFRMAFDNWLTFAVFESQKEGKRRKFWAGWDHE